MPVYNSEEFLRECIDSILNQTFTDFEFLICDDGSTDGSNEILSSYNDPRIKLFRNEQNLGLVYSLNNLIDQSQGEYLARQDSDDISLPNRFQKQIDFLNKHSEITLCGTNNTIFGDKKIKLFRPQNDDELKAWMIIHNPISHTSVMFRKSNPPVYYDKSFFPAEDYALWFELSKTSKIANLPDHLIYYRWHNKGISQLKRDKQIEKSNIIRANILNYTLSYKTSIQEKNSLDHFLDSKLESFEEVKILENLLLLLLKKNENVKYYNHTILQKTFFHVWTANCFRLKGVSLARKINIYFSSELFNLNNLISLISYKNTRSILNKYVNW